MYGAEQVLLGSFTGTTRGSFFGTSRALSRVPYGFGKSQLLRIETMGSIQGLVFWV